jgi:hypothetical protein
VAKDKKGSGSLDSLTMKQADSLARRVARGAGRLADNREFSAALELYEVAGDLHDSWTSKFDAKHGRGDS